MPSKSPAFVEGVPSENSRGWAYFFVALALGVLLIVAGALKTGPWLSGVSAEGGSGRSVLVGLAIAVELLFGLWLMLGLFPRLTRCVALGCFFGFLNIALFKALEGAASCSCFGNVPLTPWIAFTIDVVAVVALLLSPVRGAWSVPSHALRWKLGAFGFACLLVTAAGLTTGVVLAERSPVREHNALIETIVDSIARNETQIPTIQFRATLVIDNALVKKEETIVEESPTGKSITRIAPRFEEQYIYVLKGSDFRREQVRPTGPSFRVFVVNQGRQVDYTGPRTDLGVGPQAWTNWYPAGPGAEHYDPRCIGFDPQTTSVIDWLRKVRVEEATIKTESKDIFIRVTDERGQRVEVTFLHACSYLPGQICYWYPDGSLREATSVNYRQVPGTQAWFVHQGVHLTFGRGDAHAPEATNWRGRVTLAIQGEPTVNRDVSAETFNPILPKGVLFIDGINAKTSAHSYKLTKSVAAFGVIDQGDLQAGRRANTAAKGPWIAIALLDFFALVGFAVFRHKLYI